MSPSAIIICRFSPRPLKAGEAERIAAEEDAASIQLQLELGTRYCHDRGFVIAEVIKLPFMSGRVPFFERPGLARLRDLPAGTNLVFMDVDRFSRDIADGFTTLDYFHDHGIRIHFSNQGNSQIDASTADGFFFIGQKLLYASYEARKIAERTSRGMKHRQARGERMTHPDRVPYGTRYDAATNQVIPNEDERQAMRLALALRNAGRTQEDIGYEIQPLVRGGQWNPSRQNVAALLKAAEAQSA